MFFLFLALWLIFNGKFTWEIFGIGVALALAIYLFFCIFMNYSPKKEWQTLRKLPWFIRYIAVLLWEIIKANFAVIRLILSDRLEPEPVLFRFHLPLQRDIDKVILANSITLAPGTITVDTKDDIYVVHALDKDLAEGTESSVFVQMLQDLEEQK